MRHEENLMKFIIKFLSLVLVIVGWAVWEIFGGYNMWTGRMYPDFNTINTHGDWQTMDSNINPVLFDPSL